MSVPHRAGIGAVSFLQEPDLVKLEYAVNDAIESWIAEGATILSVTFHPVPYIRTGEFDQMLYFATVTVDTGDEE